ncbi:c-type cytochrome [Microscilla marina]|uniref:CytoChrome c subfamily, putative n=1 Tax=Microscilla marina ATCC 23134 TaxID=313606 RepID=A1ZI65_MICM2|nr:cytochrome c [Microscilla marina]EAY29733.1 cytoChrome c subfamily, putative [Microscilla marina ATCC 23134]
MIPFIEKLSQIFTLIALSVAGLIVTLVNVDVKETAPSRGCGTVSEYSYQDTVQLSGTVSVGKTLFYNNCMQCHSAGADVIVGPGLKGILDRRSIDWLIPWVQNSQKVIASGDPYAIKLYNKYGKTTMQSFDLTADEIKAIFAYVQSYKQAVYYLSEVVVCQ